MSTRHNLSIVIPTYNRANFLDILLEKHVNIFRQCNIPVFIYNNASTDDTDLVIDKWKREYHLITSKTNTGDVLITDESIETALKLSNTKYRWLLGDSYYLSSKLVRHVSGIISQGEDVDLYILNLNNIIKDIPSSICRNNNQLLSNFSTIMACVSCQIYHEKIINSDNFNKYKGSSFLQLGITLEYASGKNFCANWVQNFSVTSLKNKSLEKKNWSTGKSVLKVGAKKWTEFIFSLPESYSTAEKLIAIKNFGKQTKIFTIQGLMLMRVRGNLNYASYKQYSKEIALMVDYPFVVIIISIIPISLLKVACVIFTRIFNKNKTKQWCFNE